MTKKSSNTNIALVVTIVVAIIGGIGTICAATIGAIANYNVEQLRQQSELTRIALISNATQGNATQAPIEGTINAPTELPSSTYTPYPSPYPTLTVEPLIIPTEDTRPTDTPPGTVLQIGETWTTQGFSVQLRSLTFAFGDEADLQFTFTNNTGRTLFFHLSKDNHIIMKDNSGKIYVWATPYEDDLIIENGTSRDIPVYKGGNFSGIQYLIITVDLPSLIYAQWKY